MSGDTRIKNHHFLPKSLQKHFTINNNEQNIWYADKSISTGQFKRPELRNIESVFRIKDLYTISKSGKLSDIVERTHYGPIDDALGKILPEIKSVLNKGGVPKFSDSSLTALRRIVIEMFKRTPEFGFDEEPDKVGSRVITEILDENIESLTEQEIVFLKSELNNNKRVKALGREIITRAKINKMNLVDGVLDRYSIRWVETDPKHSFILSSLCCYRIGNGGSNGLGNINAEVWMPISPRYCMVMVQDPYGKVPLRLPIDTRKIREVNEFAARHSNSIASHSQELIESLTGQKAR